MKKTISYLMMTLMVSALMVTANLAQGTQGKSRSGSFTLNESLIVGETVLEKGQYRLKFDAETNELQVLRDGDVVKSVKARVQENPKKAAYHALETRSNEKGRMLVGVKFEGDRRSFLVDETNGNSVAGEGQN